MKKIHTRAKRNIGLTSSKRRPASPKSVRPKTFKTEATAQAWAKEQGIAEKSYKLVPAKKNKKFMVKEL